MQSKPKEETNSSFFHGYCFPACLSYQAALRIPANTCPEPFFPIVGQVATCPYQLFRLQLAYEYRKQHNFPDNKAAVSF